MSWLKKLTTRLSKTSGAITGGLRHLLGKPAIDASSVESIEDALIMADLGVSVATDITQSLSRHKWKEDITPENLRAVLADLLCDQLSGAEQPLALNSDGLQIMLLVGVNGSGKTTTAGKLAAYFTAQGKKVVLAAADTFRAAAIEQIVAWGKQTGIEVITAARGSDAAALVFRAIEAARSDGADLLIIDTAGRLQNRTELMEELAKITRVIKKQIPKAPHHSLIILDGTVGQNAILQVKAFAAPSELTGMIITKLDGTAKGGIVVALAREFGLPIHMIGVGEAADDLQEFTARDFADALVGNGPSDENTGEKL